VCVVKGYHFYYNILEVLELELRTELCKGKSSAFIYMLEISNLDRIKGIKVII